MTVLYATLCVICGRREPRAGLVCDADFSRVRADLAEIPDLHADLPAALIPERGAGQAVTGSREAPLPIRLDVVDLALPARHAPVRDWWQDQTGYLSVATVLDSWALDWLGTRAQGECRPEPRVQTLAGWLDARLPWACDYHHAVDEFARDLSDLTAALRAIVGEATDREYLGPCPVMRASGHPCGGRLSGSPWVEVVECPRCSTRWERRKWLLLGAAIQQQQAEMSQPHATVG